MENAYFYSSVDETKENRKVLNYLKSYAEKQSQQVYVINSALGSNYKYDYSDALVILIPKKKIVIVNYGKDIKGFENYKLDFLDDLGHISDKYDYKNTIGRQRVWEEKIIKSVNIEEIETLEELIKISTLENREDERLSQLLISLLTGSINDINKVGIENPEDLLDAVKRRIVLYDALQTEFIFKKSTKKIVKIQGLAGTGKTELLLRKLKEIYTTPESKDKRIALTCFNKILAKNLKDRIPQFFDFLRVQEQIKWDETLFVMSSWGSNNNRFSGLYSYICSWYNLPFYAYAYDESFDDVCKKALTKLNEMPKIECCFDYMLIDESQDFPQSFFDLCDKVTEKQIFIAGDVFQNIFDLSEKETNPDYLLNKCYRTDPKTLIFSHAMGMGLLDGDATSNYISWLTNEEWKMCGYDFESKNGNFTLTRKPLNRFDDIDTSKILSVEVKVENFDNYVKSVLDIITELKKQYSNIKPDDIGIVFLEGDRDNYKMVDYLSYMIYQEFNWMVNKGYESKTKKENTLFVSNINNVKGLEFPFIICLSKNRFNTSLRIRNAMYMVLTRSFISSYFVISQDNDKEVINSIQTKLQQILDNGALTIKEPSQQEKDEKRTAVISKKNINKSQKEIANEYMDKLNIDSDARMKIHKGLRDILEDENDVTIIQSVIDSLLQYVR